MAARAPLRPATPIATAAIQPSDIPRWVEVLAAGSDPNGTLYIQGNAREGNGITEDLSMNSTLRQISLEGTPTSVTTFVGLAPMIFDRSLEAQFLIPMAVSMGFGILFTTVITLYLVPCTLIFADDVGRHWAGFRQWYFRPFSTANLEKQN